MNKKRIYSVITIILLVLTLIPSLSLFYSAEAGWLCSSMGGNMDRNSFPRSAYKGLIKADEPNRKWTVEEIFKKSLAFTSYYGEGEGDWIFANKVDRGASRGGSDWSDATVQDNLKAARGLSCVIGKGDMLPNMGLGIASAIAGLISSSMNNFVGKDTMVDGLVKIIGGTGGNNGLISIFFHSIYAPLIVIAVLFTGVTILYKGLIQMKLREALSSIIWSVSAFVIGVALMLTPNLLVKAPQVITSTITTCVLGALNGENCLTGEVTTPSLLAGTECASRIEGDLSSADMMVNGMSCTIWKTFVLEPWAEEQFGASYSDLYTHNAPDGGGIWDGLEGDGKKYCVNLASSESASSARGSIKMDRNDNSTVCNIALYQLYLMTAMEDTVNHSEGYSLTTDSSKSDAPYDERWFDIIVPMAKHSSNWRNWSGQGKFLGRIGTANMSVIAVTAAATVLIVLSILGAAYKITAVIMMAFAPLFLLFAVEPTRGRRIFLGWLETFFSALLKYFAIAILSIVSLVLYAGVLSTTKGIASFVSVIILTAALMMYRKEVVDLIGASNMGGQRLTNQASKSIDWVRKQGKEKGAALTGGAIGGMIGANRSRRADIEKREENIKDLQLQLSQATQEQDTDRIDILKDAIKQNEDANKETKSFKNVSLENLKSMGEGASNSIGRTMRRGNSMTATAFKQANMTKVNLDKRYEAERSKEGLKLKEELIAQEKQREAEREAAAKTAASNEKPQRDSRVENQRDKNEYKGNLTDEEIKMLDKFADSLVDINDDDLAAMTKDEELMKDENKKSILANELNARLRADTLDGVASNPALFINGLANIKNLSGAEITLLMNIHRTDYLNTGDEKAYNKYKDFLTESKSRGIIDEEEYKVELEEIKDYRDIVAANNVQISPAYYSIEELEKLQISEPEKYEQYMKSLFETSPERKDVSPELLDREAKRQQVQQTEETQNTENAETTTTKPNNANTTRTEQNTEATEETYRGPFQDNNAGEDTTATEDIGKPRETTAETHKGPQEYNTTENVNTSNGTETTTANDTNAKANHAEANADAEGKPIGEQSAEEAYNKPFPGNHSSGRNSADSNNTETTQAETNKTAKPFEGNTSNDTSNAQSVNRGAETTQAETYNAAKPFERNTNNNTSSTQPVGKNAETTQVETNKTTKPFEGNTNNDTSNTQSVGNTETTQVETNKTTKPFEGNANSDTSNTQSVDKKTETTQAEAYNTAKPFEENRNNDTSSAQPVDKNAETMQVETNKTAKPFGENRNNDTSSAQPVGKNAETTQTAAKPFEGSTVNTNNEATSTKNNTTSAKDINNKDVYTRTQESKEKVNESSKPFTEKVDNRNTTASGSKDGAKTSENLDHKNTYVNSQEVDGEFFRNQASNKNTNNVKNETYNASKNETKETEANNRSPQESKQKVYAEVNNNDVSSRNENTQTRNQSADSNTQRSYNENNKSNRNTRSAQEKAVNSEANNVKEKVQNTTKNNTVETKEAAKETNNNHATSNRSEYNTQNKGTKEVKQNDYDKDNYNNKQTMSVNKNASNPSNTKSQNVQQKSEKINESKDTKKSDVKDNSSNKNDNIFTKDEEKELAYKHAKEEISKSKDEVATSEEIDWENEFWEDGLESNNSRDFKEKEIDIDDFYDNLDDFLK